MSDIIKFRDTICRAKWSRYLPQPSANFASKKGRLRLDLVADDGYPIATASINLVDEYMSADEMALNHDFAKDMEISLVKAGICFPSHRTVKPDSSFVTFNIVRLPHKALRAASTQLKR